MSITSYVLATTKRVRRDRTAAGTSKQSGGTTATDRCTNRKQSISTARPHHSSIRRGSQFHEVHIAMLPDLSGKEKAKKKTYYTLYVEGLRVKVTFCVSPPAHTFGIWRR